MRPLKIHTTKADHHDAWARYHTGRASSEFIKVPRRTLWRLLNDHTNMLNHIPTTETVEAKE